MSAEPSQNAGPLSVFLAEPIVGSAEPIVKAMVCPLRGQRDRVKNAGPLSAFLAEPIVGSAEPTATAVFFFAEPTVGSAGTYRILRTS